MTDTWVYGFELVLDDCNDADAGHQGDTDHLEADVQPLHGGVAGKQTSLVLLQTLFVLLLKPAQGPHMSSTLWDTNLISNSELALGYDC